MAGWAFGILSGAAVLMVLFRSLSSEKWEPIAVAGVYALLAIAVRDPRLAHGGTRMTQPKVYLVWEGDYEPTLEGVFVSKDLAERYVDTEKKRRVRAAVKNAKDSGMIGVGPDFHYPSVKDARELFASWETFSITETELQGGR